MANELPRCPQCGGAVFDSFGGTICCRYCGTEFNLSTDLCPGCGLLNPPQQMLCARCGSRLEPDAVGRMLRERLRTDRQWRQERQEVVRGQVAQDLLSSQRRMEALLQEDRKRVEAEQRALAAARQRERRLLITWGMIVLFVLVLGVGLAVVISLLRTGGG
ncbi:MAG: zinc ribbon domain-containing protein [Chloroflexota bacterium]|nr:zinc ribbon domain-containing protein [Chloroflexota bacterium]